MTKSPSSPQAPFPYFGGKSRVAHVVWERLGDVANYVEPFFGSGAVLLARPHEPRTETVNDKDCMVANFWRAVRFNPEETAHHADWPVNENDLHARHAWLVGQKDDIRARIEGDPEWCDPKAAGWWCWGLCCWIGGGFCSGQGPWFVENGQLVLGTDGRGVNRQLVHLGGGRGVSRQLVHLETWFHDLSTRFARVRVCSGDWSRVCTSTPMEKQGQPIGVFLDPPYVSDDRADCYTEDCFNVGHDVARWAFERGDDPRYRIALCGYEGEYEIPEGWQTYAWKTKGGYASQSSRGNVNATRERIWFSPHCLNPHRDRQMEFGL